MATKADVMAAIEAIAVATAAAAKVANALVVDQTPPTQDADVIIKDEGGGSLLITTRAGIDTVKWTLVSNTPPNYPFYGSLNLQTVPAGGLRLKPAYIKSGDFVKVLFGANYAQSLDGPKNSVVDTPPPIIIGTGPFKFISQWTVGVNIERLRPNSMQYSGQSIRLQPYYDYLAAMGVTHVRFFIPYNEHQDFGLGTGGAPSVSRWDGILDAVQAATLARLYVMVGCTDVLAYDRMATVYTHVENVAKRIAERGLDPTKVAVECANELAEGDNAVWNPIRMKLHGILRAKLPQHVIVHGAYNWNDINSFDGTWQAPPDKNSMAQFHNYSNGTDWSGVATRFGKFTQLHGIPMVNGEQGDDFQHSDASQESRWIDDFNRMAANAGLLRPCPWTVTDGGAFRISRGGQDATLTSGMENAVRGMVSTIKKLPGWGS